MDVVPDIATLTALQRDRLRLLAVIETQERLEATRRLQDVEDLRKELAEDDEIDAAIENQRQLLDRAAKERFETAESAHQKQLQELRDAARARKRQSPPLRVRGGPSRVQRQRLSGAPRCSQINTQ